MNKKTLLFALAIFLLAIFSFLVGGFLNRGSRIVSAPKEPEIFVAREVVSAERQDLIEFAQVWQQALSKDLTFEDYKELALGAGGRFNNVPVLKVGQETLYGNDLNYLALFYAFEDYSQGVSLPESVLNELADIAMEDSVWLQKGAEKGLINLNESFFNSSEKDYTERNRLITLSKKALGQVLIPRISGESVAIWFNNDGSPDDLPLESRKQLALQKLKPIYDQIKAGQLTFKEAGEMIVNDQEIGQKLDASYEVNAYMAFDQASRDEGPFSFKNLNQEVWSLGEGQASEILVGKNLPEEGGVAEENLFIIIRVNRRTGTLEAESSSEMMEGFIEETEVVNL